MNFFALDCFDLKQFGEIGGNMVYSSSEHQKLYMSESEALKADGRDGRDLLTVVYILTALPFSWPKVKPYVVGPYVDLYGCIENEVLSSGEKLLVQYAGNLYNGNFPGDFSPWDMIGRLDKNLHQVIAAAYLYRAGI